jgi:hypothetical protein
MGSDEGGDRVPDSRRLDHDAALAARLGAKNRWYADLDDASKDKAKTAARLPAPSHCFTK